MWKVGPRRVVVTKLLLKSCCRDLEEDEDEDEVEATKRIVAVATRMW